MNGNKTRRKSHPNTQAALKTGYASSPACFIARFFSFLWYKHAAAETDLRNG